MTDRILVTGAGGAAAVAFMRAFDGADVEFYAADADGHAAGLYLVPPERRMVVPLANESEFVPALLAACARHQIDVLVPTVDAELLPVARAGQRFARLGVRTMVAAAATLQVVLDKALLLSCVAGRMWVPRFAVLDASFAVDAWPCPVFVKPRTGSGSRGARVVATRAELAALPRDGRLLVQELLPGEEYSVDVLADRDGRIVAAVPRVRLKVDSGVCVAARTIRDPELEQTARDVARAIGLTGIANLQFKRDRYGRPGLLEVNPRVPGTLSLTVASGINMPRLALDDLLERRPAAAGEFREVAVVRTWQEHYVEVAEVAAMEAQTAATVRSPEPLRSTMPPPPERVAAALLA